MDISINSAYLRYKLDTDRIASWLGKTALNYGLARSKLLANPDASDPFNDDEAKSGVTAAPKPKTHRNAGKSKKGKGKGKSSKNASTDGKAQAVGVDDDRTAPRPPRRPRYLFSIDRYVEIAKFIAEQDMLRDLVRPGGHQYFVDVLEQVESILTAARQRTCAPASILSPAGYDPGPSAPSETVDLTAEDMADIELPMPCKPINMSTAMSTDADTFALQLDQYEALVGLMTFFADVDALREHLRDLWERYKRSEVDLVTAAVTSNTALELLRDIARDVEDRLAPHLGDEVGNMVSVAYNIALKRDEDNARMQRPPIFKSVTDPRQQALYDKLLVPNQQYLSGLADIVEPGAIPTLEWGHHGKYETAHASDFQSRWKAHVVLIGETLGEYFALLYAGRDGPLRRFRTAPDRNYFHFDQTAQEMDRLQGTGKISLMLLVSSQIYLDVNNVLREQSVRAEKETREAMVMMASTLRRRGTTVGAAWQPAHEQMTRDMLQEVEYWIKGDPVMETYARAIPGYDKLPQESSLFARTPILCGLLLFNLQLGFRSCGRLIANTSNSIRWAVHLVTAARLSGNAPPPAWPDIDLVTQICNPTDIFFGPVPRTLPAAVERLMAAHGAPPEAITFLLSTLDPSKVVSTISARRAQSAKWRTGIPAGLQDADYIKLVPAFMRKLHGTVAGAGAIVASGTITEDDDCGKSAMTSVHLVRAVLVDLVPGPVYRLVDMLTVLERPLRQEMAALRFVYLSMHLTCTEVLGRVVGVHAPAVWDALFEILREEAMARQRRAAVSEGMRRAVREMGATLGARGGAETQKLARLGIVQGGIVAPAGRSA